jgi:hypothetical protein
MTGAQQVQDVVEGAVEQCAVLIGRREGAIWRAILEQAAVGRPAEVEFDWAWTLEREEARGDVAGFYHTHPAGPAALSSRDVRTMRAWVGSLGKPLLCLIESDGDLAAYLFATDEDPGRRLSRASRSGVEIEVQDGPS